MNDDNLWNAEEGQEFVMLPNGSLHALTPSEKEALENERAKAPSIIVMSVNEKTKTITLKGAK